MYSCDTYALTEDERNAGLGELLCSNEREHYKEKNSLQKTKQKNTIYELLNSAVSNKHIRDTILTSIIKNNFNDMIEMYVKNEKLTKEFESLAFQPNCIKILIKGLLKKECKIGLTEKLLGEIDELCAIINLNISSDIVYDRVADIQEFIHETVQFYSGAGAHENLDYKIMRKILSTARLHLNIFDITSKSLESLINMIQKTNDEIHAEYMNPSIPNYIDDYSKFIPIWKAWNMKPLLNFTYLDQNDYANFLEILNLDISGKKEDFLEELKKILKLK